MTIPPDDVAFDEVQELARQLITARLHLDEHESEEAVSEFLRLLDEALAAVEPGRLVNALTGTASQLCYVLSQASGLDMNESWRRFALLARSGYDEGLARGIDLLNEEGYPREREEDS